MDYKRILEGVVNIINTTEKSDIGFVNICTYIGENCPELRESEDERVRKALVELISTYQREHENGKIHGVYAKDILAWLEKQGDKDKLIKELGEYKVKYTQEVLKEHIDSMNNKEDEMIRKEIIDFIYDKTDTYELREKSNSWLAWLEKQGEKKQELLTKEKALKNSPFVEQNPADKVEPKFKVGNWYQCTKDFFGKGVTFDKNTAYYCAKEGCLQNEYGCHIAIVKDLYDNFKLWTIQDAKDGDVLAAKSGNRIFLYNGNCDLRHRPCAYCGTYKGFSEILFSKCAIGNYFTDEDVYPATKKQRDLLFQKMKESGYEWDAEKKELKEIEQKPTNIVTVLNDYFAITPKEQQDKDWEELKHLNNFGWEVVEQNPAWSEYDCLVIESIVQTLEITGDKGANRMKIDFLKSLKSRVQPQPRQEWSEEDKRSIRDSIFYLKSAKKYFEKDDDILWDEKWFNLCIEFLEALYKKLQPQPQWKPSDEQMKVLDVAIKSSHLTTAEYNGLVKLREQLKKL